MRIELRRNGMLVAAALFAAACVGGMLAGAPGVQAQQAGGSAAELQYRLDRLDAEIADIRARLGFGPSAPGGGAAAALSGSRVTELEGEVRRLTAMVEEMQNRQRRIAEEAARRFSDVEFRLTELEGGDIGVLQPVPPLGGLDGLPAGGAGQGAGPSSQTGTQVAAVSVAEQGDLDRAAADVQQGRYDQAEQRLRAFLQDYPASPLTGDAWYWLGESQSTRGNHAEAARSYLQGYNADRRGSRAAQNLYRLGATLGRLGQTSEACLTLREVSAQFPGAADIVDRAEAEADSLACG